MQTLDRSRVVYLLLVALVPTALNALQPLAIDDGIYLQNAQQIFSDPLKPYGGSLRFGGADAPRMDVLAPPVLPYWWAFSMMLVGASIPLAKLLLFPFAALLTFSTDSLARRFAPELKDLIVVLVVLSPWILPGFIFMLDVPALALGLAGLVLFLRSCDRQSTGGAILAGLVAGLAMQTKYNMATIPAAMLLYGLVTRQIVLALLAGIAAAATFIAVEAAIWLCHGQTHLLGPLRAASGRGFSSVRIRTLGYGLFGNTGLMGVALIPIAAAALGVSARGILAILLACAAATLAILVGADAWIAMLIPGMDAEKFPTLLHLSGLLGIVMLVAMTPLTWRLAAQKYDPITWFLVVWLIVEFTGYFVMSPFPATRRHFGLLVVLSLIVCRAAIARNAAEPIPRRLLIPVAALSVVAGLGTWLIGYVDGVSRRDMAQLAAVRAKAHTGPLRAWVWSNPSEEYYAVQAGLERIVLMKSELAPGEVLVISPPEGATLFGWDLSALELIDDVTAGPNLHTTITPYFFYGQRPIYGRPDTRPHAALYRVKAPTVIRLKQRQPQHG